MKSIRRICAVALSVTVAAGTIVFAAPQTDERITVIVEMSGNALLETENARETGYKLFSETDEAREEEENIRLMQSETAAQIKNGIDGGAQIGYTYTHVFNGFSIEIHKSDIEKVKALPNVENIYISHTYQLFNEPLPSDEPYLDNGCEMMNAGYIHNLGITGKGTVIAVIDAGFDVSHENFQGEISEPRLSKGDIAEKINNENLSINTLGANVTVNRVYRSEKIPYAFNYSQKSSDVINLLTSHGTHVAGIAAGNNGTDPTGRKFIGTAPDAQLLLMACTDLTDEAVIAAIDDSVKLGADVINASFGETYFESKEPERKAVETAVNAGVLFSAAAGNESRGYKNSNPNVTNIDYGTSAVPALDTAATAVASMNSTKIWYGSGSSQTLYDIPPSMSYFSSWGVGSSLELKPEITTPGGGIYSSINDDKYSSMSGTSMAAPHMTGATSLMTEYIRKHPEKYGAQEEINIGRIAENLIMTGADTLLQSSENGIPYSPRLQGAGLVNLENAAKTPVILIGDKYTLENGTEIKKTKISLGEIEQNVEGQFNLSFTAENLTDTPVTYDSVAMTVITDAAKEDGNVGNMKKLRFTSDLPASVTVAAKDETRVGVTVTLDAQELSENAEVFENGFYIDGYIFLADSTNELPQISIPFMGFYGDWEKAPALDKPYFDENSVLKGTYMYDVSARNTDGSFAGSAEVKVMGTNRFVDSRAEDYDDYSDENYVGYSPNGDRVADIPSAVIIPLRKIGKTDFAICDTDGNELFRKTDIDSGTGEDFYCEKFTESYLYFDEDKVNSLPDGDYIFRVFADFYAMKNYEQNENVEMKFYIDREKPVITKYELSEDGKSLSIAAKDNRHLMGIVVSGTKNGQPYSTAYPIKALKEYEMTADISGIDEDTLCVEVVDYAQNSVKKAAKELNITLLQRSGSNYLFSVNNTTGEDIHGTCIMALYRNGALVGVSYNNNSIPQGDTFKTFNVEDTAYDKIKLFIWDSIESMQFLYHPFEF